MCSHTSVLARQTKSANAKFGNVGLHATLRGPATDNDVLNLFILSLVSYVPAPVAVDRATNN